MEKLNRYLPLLNFFAFVVLIVLVFFLVYEKKSENNSLYGKDIEPLVAVYVVKDNIIGKLDGKNIEVLNLEPLQIKVKDGNLFITKEGRWIKLEKGYYVLIIKQEDSKSLIGQKN